MKVLVLNGSPKGEQSNTMHLTRSFLEGAGWLNAEVIPVAKTDIKACFGCFACWNKTPGKCVIKDEMGKILDKMIVADVIVWSFPLYYFSVPGGLKNLIDRQLPLALPLMEKGSESGGHPSRYDLGHQKHVIISTCGFWTAKGNYDAVNFMFDHFLHKYGYTTIYCGQGELFHVPELKTRTNKYLEIICHAGAEYAVGGIQSKTKSQLEEPLYPREVFEKMADASWGIETQVDKGATNDNSFSYTKQMAALYKPDGVERIIEIYYTDIDKTYQILLTKQGSKLITDDFKSYTTRIETPFQVWRSIARGEISGQEALFQRLYKVTGDFSLMLKWDDLFGEQTSQKPTEQRPAHKTNMLLLLLPWIVIWVAIAINPFVGSALGIGTAALIPILWIAFRPVIYEQFSIPIVIGLSLAILLGGDARLIIPVSYFLFGLMWLLGSFHKIPLTAYYSANNYGGEDAYSNALFIRTNRILTAIWGVLYLVTPIWTYILMGTTFSPYIGLLNSVLPALIGVFTAWFQKWYPARYARR
ncbi:NAD(P)H-dependent oxidoreductase [Clostridium sp. E02]|uniref:NAD(P)H-dependent oxidoreductase n=1 Tax=Clostridium sp. E02 TaxID=2487134 RepID=UPI000F52C88F|nr:NAD(P)H-dependent oxidoreductase [Clostridium sp. E02]